MMQNGERTHATASHRGGSSGGGGITLQTKELSRTVASHIITKLTAIMQSPPRCRGGVIRGANAAASLKR
jgi:hypothetical protein